MLAGCAYFNALYNANRLFDRGRKEIQAGNESSGRTALAESIRKAENALERDPDGRWADDALRLIVRARLLRGEYVGAAVAAGRLWELAESDSERRRAAELLGRALVHTGEPERADSLLTFALAGDVSDESRAEAHAARADARRRLGRFSEADADYISALRLRSDAARLRLARFYLLLEAERVEDAATELRELLRRPQDAVVEDDIVAAADSVARRAPETARGALAVAHASPLRSAARARLVARRGSLTLAAGDVDSARADFERAAALGPGTDGATAGLVALARLELARADSVADLVLVKEHLARATLTGSGRELIEARALGTRVDRVLQMVKAGDVAWITAGELARDSLGAPYLARAFFLRFAEDFPFAVWAPKAILAALALGPYPYGAPAGPSDEALRERLRADYTSNPYVEAVWGEPESQGRSVEAFATAEQALDDRIRTWLAQAGLGTGRIPPVIPDTTEEARRRRVPNEPRP